MFQGPEMLLSDLLIFPLIFIFEERHRIIEKFPHIKAWIDNIQSMSNVKTVLCDLVNQSELISNNSDLSLLPPAGEMNKSQC